MRELTQEEYEDFINYIKLAWPDFGTEFIICRCGSPHKAGSISEDKTTIMLHCENCMYIFLSFLTRHMGDFGHE